MVSDHEFGMGTFLGLDREGKEGGGETQREGGGGRGRGRVRERVREGRVEADEMVLAEELDGCCTARVWRLATQVRLS